MDEADVEAENSFLLRLSRLEVGILHFSLI